MAVTQLITDNLHPADELFRLRSEKLAIENRINELRAIIIDLPGNERHGRDVVTKVVERDISRPDIKRIRYEMGQKWIDERSVATPTTFVNVARRK